jgi:nucleoside-diphosphate-sugar epimerase
VSAAVHGTEFELLGDGQQTRDFTFVGDVVAAMQAAASVDWCGVANIGGGSRVSMNSIISLIESMAGPVAITRQSAHRGDVRHTAADVTVAVREFGYAPKTTASEGLAAMLSWAADEHYQAAL